MNEIIITNSSVSVIKERATRLAESIKEVKDRGIEVLPYEPIEGKMFWSKDE